MRKTDLRAYIKSVPDWSPPDEVPKIATHHRIYASGTLGRPRGDGQQQANPIFQIETLNDEGAWDRRATGYSTMRGAQDALRACQCPRCEIAKVRRVMQRLDREVRVLQSIAGRNRAKSAMTKRRRPTGGVG